MKEKKDKTKKDLENEVEALTASNQEQLLQLQQLSAGYQAAVQQAQQMNMLVNRYEETINLLTSRLIESRAQPLSSAEDSQN